MLATLDISDHTTNPVCETGVWSLTSQSKLSKKKPGLTDSGMATGVKKTRSVRPWYGLWHSDANWDRKNIPVWHTVVWPLRLQKPSLSERGVANGVTKFRMVSGGLKGGYVLNTVLKTSIDCTGVMKARPAKTSQKNQLELVLRKCSNLQICSWDTNNLDNSA